eukprot:10673370-Alexandrium_andersonii.AAC.1
MLHTGVQHHQVGGGLPEAETVLRGHDAQTVLRGGEHPRQRGGPVVQELNVLGRAGALLDELDLLLDHRAESIARGAVGEAHEE